MKNEVASNDMHNQVIGAFLPKMLQMKVMIHDEMNAINVRIIYFNLMILLYLVFMAMFMYIFEYFTGLPHFYLVYLQLILLSPDIKNQDFTAYFSMCLTQISLT